LSHVEVSVALSNPEAGKGCTLHVEIAGKTATVSVAISDVIDRVLIGVTTLETLGLIVDPLTSQLKESSYLLY